MRMEETLYGNITSVTLDTRTTIKPGYNIEVDVGGGEIKTINGLPTTTENVEVGRKIMLRYIQSPGVIAGLKRAAKRELFDKLQFHIFA